MRVIYHNWSATTQRPHPQSVAEISHHSVLSGDSGVTSYGALGHVPPLELVQVVIFPWTFVALHSDAVRSVPRPQTANCVLAVNAPEN